ncbi:MAG TPA: histidine kinase, partial [Chitinophagaceae bacterium]|nr:histidine kinase [Chitinophagaceae bacterium]
YLVEEIFFPAAFGFRNYYRGVPLSYYLVDNLYFSIFYSLFGVLYFFLQNEHRRTVEHQQLLLENQRTQLSFLRSQVNPHFLFNSLNNIYALVYRQSPKALEAVALLSDQLRYMLYQEQEEVEVQKEWDYIRQYIRLQRLRFEQPLEIEEKVSGSDEGLRVPPLLLIPFVENAFKHGDFRAAGPHIELELAAEPGRLRFRISNTKGPREKDAVGGIGLQNLRRRLELLYPGRHSLLTKDAGNRFTAELEVTHAG